MKIITKTKNLDKNLFFCSLNRTFNDVEGTFARKSKKYENFHIYLAFYSLNCIFAFAMGNIKIRRGDFDTKLELEHASVVAGFPSPADDYRHEKLDFNRDYIRHPEASVLP